MPAPAATPFSVAHARSTARSAQVGAAIGEPKPLYLLMDATEAPRGRFRGRMSIPVRPGPLTLAYPKWVQGEHGPTGPITQLTGLSFTAHGKALPWRRDAFDLYLFHLEVPNGVDTLTAEYDYLSPVTSFGTGYGRSPNATPHLLVVDWHDLLLYPLGPSADDQQIQARLRLPAGWKQDGALAAQVEPDGTLTLPATSLTTLLDSPILAGEHVRTEVLEGGDRPAVMSLAADRASSLAFPADQLAPYRRLPTQARALFSSRPYRSYHWLMTLADSFPENGLEHQESTDLREPSGFFIDEAAWASLAQVPIHEYLHAWNGKSRRPSGLAVRDPQQPLDGELLWVYEGLTQYLDWVLAARCGLRTPETSRDILARWAAIQDQATPGRAWRPLVDTARSVQDLFGAPTEWSSWRRSADFYPEAALVWLEVDALLRERSGDRSSLDDFCRAFFGGADGLSAVRPYTRADVEAALDRLLPFDWHGFFQSRIYEVAPRAPLGGLSRSGWKLSFEDRPNAFQKMRDAFDKQIDHTLSLGLALSPEGAVKDVVIEAPAWKGGFGPGMKVVAVNGRAFNPAVLDEELRAAQKATAPMAFTIQQGEDLKVLNLDWHGGARYPHLERDPAQPDRLAQILAPRGAAKK